MNKRLIALCVFVCLALGHGLAHAARTYTYVQTPAAAAALFDMGSTNSLSYLITNTATGGNAGERIFSIRFRLSGTGSLFSNTIVAPAGWSRSAWSTTSVTFRATSWANALAVGGSASFTLILAPRSTTADLTETLLDMRASYTTSSRFRTAGTTTTNNPGSWTLKSLAITLFQITDLSGVPIASVAAGSSFRLVMTIKNNSTVTQSGIASNPNPPGSVETGTVTQGLTGTVTSPSPLNLASLASGTITFTFSTAPGDNGTIYFTASAQRGGTVTSRTATSPTLAVVVCVFSANITVSSSCQYPGLNVSLTMALTNSCPFSLSTVTPSLSTTGPATLVSGPTPATVPTIAASGGTASVGWVYQINNAAAPPAPNPFTFSGSATSSAPVKSTPTSTSPSITRGEFPTFVTPNVTNASSTNVELTWNVTNSGCAAVNSVAVTFPAGWVWANDAYSLVDLSAANSVETWVPGGANPVTFTSPDIASRLPLTFGGDFSLVFSATPATTGISNFTVNVTDANGITVPVTVPVTVNPFDPDGLNNVTGGIRIWREQFP